jgi:hypothetical protein
MGGEMGVATGSPFNLKNGFRTDAPVLVQSRGRDRVSTNHGRGEMADACIRTVSIADLYNLSKVLDTSTLS